MGNLFLKPEHEDRNIVTETMSSRSARSLRHSQKNPSGSVESMQEHETNLDIKAGDTEMSRNKRQPYAGAGPNLNKKQIKNKTLNPDSAKVILDDMKQCCSNLRSMERRIKNTTFSAIERNELNNIVKYAQSAVASIIRIEHNAPTIDSASIPLRDTENSGTLTKIAIADTKDDASGFLQEKKFSLPLNRNKETRCVGNEKVEDSVPENTVYRKNSLATENSSGSYESEVCLEILKIKSYMKKLKKGVVENEYRVIETLKGFEKFLSEYVNNSDQKIVDIANPILLDVTDVLTHMLSIQKQKEISVCEKLEEEQDNTEHFEEFCDRGKGDLDLKKLSLANEDIESEKKYSSKHSDEHAFIDENSCRDGIKKLNTNNARSVNEKEIDNIVETGGGLDCFCSKKQYGNSINGKCQNIESISLEDKNQSDDKRSSNENKLKQIENRRNEIKSEIDCFVGTSSDPKFQELNEYSVRLLLEMDDLILPKGSDQHKRKRELLKEVYQYSDILDEKAKDSEFLVQVENDINCITTNFDSIKKSGNELTKVAKIINYAKFNLYRKHYGNLLEEKKQRYIDELHGLEEAVNHIMHRENTKSSLASKSREIEDFTLSTNQNGASGDTSIQTNNLPSNNGINRNENVTVNPEKCNEQSHYIENESAETIEIIEKNKPVNQVQKILTRQKKKESQNSFIAEDENSVNPSNQLRSIEGLSGDSHSGRDVIKYEANTPTETDIDDIEKKVSDAIKKIHSFDDFAALEEYLMLKDYLLREDSRLEEFNIKSEVCEGIMRRRRLVKNEILLWLNHLEQQIQTLRSISTVEFEIQKVGQIIEVSTEEPIHELRNHLLYLLNSLQAIPNNGKRLEKCYERIQLYLEKINGETKNCNFGTMV